MNATFVFFDILDKYLGLNVFEIIYIKIEEVIFIINQHQFIVFLRNQKSIFHILLLKTSRLPQVVCKKIPIICLRRLYMHL